MKTKLFILTLFINALAFSQVYVNKTATGANDGTSWTNAYGELSDAMAAHNGVAFWVAQGTYVPATTSTNQRNADFRLHEDDEIYGGFSGNGTETALTERNPSLYPTILSGDLNGDDNATITHAETTRQENSYHVLRAYNTAQNIIVDGVTITGGNANDTLLNPCGSGSRNDRRKGAAIMVQPEENGRIYITINNCILEKNTATDTSVYAAFNGCGQNNIISDTDFTNCIVRNNHSDTNGAFTLVAASQHTQWSRGSITNSVFYNNTSVSGASCLKVINSTGGSSSGTDMQVINSTFANNTGFNGNVMHIQRAATTDIRNSIIWGNNAGMTLNISVGSPQIVNTIVTGGTLNTDPLFVDEANDNYQIPHTSPAFNAGNNAYIPAGITTDLLGEDRIFTGTVDMGAYEYTCTSCITLNTTVVGNGNVSPGGGVYTATDVVSISATADAGWLFTGWSGDLSGSTNPTSVTMSTSKNITATFIEVPTFVDIDATGANDGSSWANAYTDLKVAITNTTAAKEIWIAEGVYIPSGATRTATFDIQKQLFIYGGFSGTETAKSQRSGGATILSGDRNGDDNATITDTEPTRQDNSYHVIMVRRHINTAGILDRVTISGGNSNGTAINAKMGAAIYANPFAQTHRVKWKFTNCIIEKNSSKDRGAVSAMYTANLVTSVTSIIDFENSTIRDNYSKAQENIFYSGSSAYGIHGRGSLINCLIYNNKTDGANKGSVLKLNGTASFVNVINTTFANNTSPNNYVIASTMSGASTASIKNSIIYNNGSALPFYLTGNTPTFSNNIVEGGQLGNTNADPLFTDATSNDFTLQTGSPAIDTGDNSFITGFTTDILGNTRINNTTVDLGCFEYDATLRVLSLNKVGNGVLSPLAGTHSFATASNITITATASPGWTFNGWTGTTTEANASFSIVLNSNMTYTAHFTENPIVYVDIDATGTGDGSSWANAYTDLRAAITLANNGTAITEVWIAEGVYTPHISNRNNVFDITKDNLILYGSFDGTETQLSERDLTANHDTILSGDLSNNDVAVGFTLSSRVDNSYNVMKVQANDVVLDGLHIEDGHATHHATADKQSGGAVFILGSVNEITFKNCQFNNNVGNKGGTIYAKYTTNAILNIENCVINNNYSLYGSGVYMLVDGAHTININVTNTLFSNNKTEDYVVGGVTYKGYTGSAMWLRANATSSNVTTTITNCTFVGNRDEGTISGSERGSLALGRRTYGTSTHNVTINNSIFYDNKRGSATTLATNHGHTSTANTVLVNNSIDEDDFSNIPAGDKVATSNADPLFTSTTDFTLQTGSPAINMGDNSKVPASITTDLAGNSRIQDTTVDMGCYESAPLATYTLTTTVTGTGSVTPSGTNTHNDGDVVSITATATTGWEFSHWTGDASGSVNPLSVTMSANMSIVAVFTQIQHELTIVSNNGATTPDSGTLSGGSYTYNYGTSVIVSATPNTGYVFDHYEITDSATNTTVNNSNNPVTVVMNDGYTVTAVFLQLHELTISNVLNGTATPDSGTLTGGVYTYTHGTSVIITATPDTGYEFDSFDVIDNATGTAVTSYASTVTITMDDSYTVDVYFSLIEHELTIVSNNGVTTPDSGTLVGGSYTYQYGTSVIVTAAADSGYYFDHYEITDNATSTTTNSASNPLTITMDDSYTVEAIFTQVTTYTLTTTVTGSGTVTPSGTTTHNDGTIVYVTATAVTGWEFSHWTGDASGSVNPLSVTMSANMSIEAVFTQIQHELTIVSNNGTTTPDSGTLTGGSYIYNYGTSVIVTASADSGYVFDHYEITDNATSTTTNSASNPLTIMMDDSYTVEAIFTSTASVEDVVNISFNIYPNPVINTLNITLDAEIENIEVFSLLGRKVLESTSKQLNVSKLEVGVYMLRVKTTSNVLITKKFIKK